MTSEPTADGTDEHRRDDPTGIQEEPSGAETSAADRETPAAGDEAGVEVTGGTWKPVLPPEVIENIVGAFRPQLPAFDKMLGNQFRTFVPKITAVVAPQFADRFQLIDFSKIAEPLLPDLSAIMPKVIAPGLSESFRDLLQQITDKMPPNWPEQADFDLVFKVIQEDGIPLVWVPRPEIVADLLAAPDRDARVKVLTARAADVAHDCRETLGQITRPDLVNMLPMASSALDAYIDGHHAPAQALSVAVVETVVTRTIGKYQQAKTFAKIDDPKKLGMAELRFRAALAPIAPFYVAWWPSSNDPMPEQLSRHVTVHQADPAHYTHGNATVAIMLLASVLRGVQEYLDLTKPSPP
ncbi:hypothetical protein [Micromonospora aurantiaca (nom. illeg.)]|uniref:hypothetical protein n=1 Tax=Micromonospora aurantiaca (nom. illeg.) TaxID=47850 RepID=UPI00340072E5